MTAVIKDSHDVDWHQMTAVINGSHDGDWQQMTAIIKVVMMVTGIQ